jgi:hypothetical protein
VRHRESRVSAATRIPVRQTTTSDDRQQHSKARPPRGALLHIGQRSLSDTRPPAERAAASVTAVAVAVPTRTTPALPSESIHRAPRPQASGPAADGRANRENYTATETTASVEDGTASGQLPYRLSPSSTIHRRRSVTRGPPPNGPLLRTELITPEQPVRRRIDHHRHSRAAFPLATFATPAHPRGRSRCPPRSPPIP